MNLEQMKKIVKPELIACAFMSPIVVFIIYVGVMGNGY